MTDVPSDDATQAGNGDEIDDKVVDATLNAYYPAILASADSARTRAQTAYTVASATAAALVAAGALADIQAYPAGVQIAGALSLLAWIAASALFMRVSLPVGVPLRNLLSQRTTQSRDPEGTLLSAGQFVMKALNAARVQGAAIDRRLADAITVVWAALILTLATIVLALVLPVQPSQQNVTLDLTPTGQTLVSSICTHDPSSISGEVETKTLSGNWVALTVSPGTCEKDQENLLIPTKDVLAVKQRRGKFPFFP